LRLEHGSASCRYVGERNGGAGRRQGSAFSYRPHPKAPSPTIRIGVRRWRVGMLPPPAPEVDPKSGPETGVTAQRRVETATQSRLGSAPWVDELGRKRVLCS
jgi:hypothetical protein